ncbi:MAG: RpiB/LacA/LacB family sugar-phosphate isomerase [Candidatus Babeliales bacterium]
MNTVILAIGTDHRGYALKEQLIAIRTVGSFAITWADVGCNSAERTDYPPYADAVVQEMMSHRARFGILLCGTGHGMAIAANRHKKIYAAVVWHESMAVSAKQDDNANILVFPADSMTVEKVVACITAWLNSAFKGGRYAERLAMIDK